MSTNLRNRLSFLAFNCRRIVERRGMSAVACWQQFSKTWSRGEDVDGVVVTARSWGSESAELTHPLTCATFCMLSV